MGRVGKGRSNSGIVLAPDRAIAEHYGRGDQSAGDRMIRLCSGPVQPDFLTDLPALSVECCIGSEILTKNARSQCNTLRSQL